MGKIMRNGVQYGVDTADVLSTVAECDASASGGKGTTQVASAKALSELNSNLGGIRFGVDTEGNWGYIKAGADTVTPFSNKGIYIIVSCSSLLQGYDITCTTGSISKTKKCGSNNMAQFYFSSSEVSSLPATFDISNNFNAVTASVTASIYGWYEVKLEKMYLYNNGKYNNLRTMGTNNLGNLGWDMGSVNYNNSNRLSLTAIRSSAQYSANGVAGVFTTNTIDLTNFKKIIVKSTWSYGLQLKLVVSGANTDFMNNYNRLLRCPQGTAELDISDIMGNKYIALFNHEQDPGITSTAYITEFSLSEN